MKVVDLTLSDATLDDATSLVVALQRNGQCAGPWPAFVESAGAVLCRVSILEDHALDPGNDSPAVAKCREPIGSITATSVGGAAESAEVCSCGQRRPFLVLFTTFVSDDTPLRCGGCWGLVPLYAIPPSAETRDHSELLAWARLYQHLDGLYMASGVGEAFAYAELTRRTSDFGLQTAALCADLERRCAALVYAFLNLQHGPPLEACPECGRGSRPEAAAGP